MYNGEFDKIPRRKDSNSSINSYSTSSTQNLRGIWLRPPNEKDRLELGISTPIL